MDKRGLTTDPNRERNTADEWWNELDSTLGPSPYSTAAWTYWHDFEQFIEPIAPGQLDGITFGSIKVYDTKASSPSEEVVIEEPEGELLGEIHYELDYVVLTVTEWSHYNWKNDKPVRQAFKVLLNEMPSCVQIIQVKDSPNAFWVSEGFYSPFKGSEMLVHKNYLQLATTF